MPTNRELSQKKSPVIDQNQFIFFEYVFLFRIGIDAWASVVKAINDQRIASITTVRELMRSTS